MGVLDFEDVLVLVAVLYSADVPGYALDCVLDLPDAPDFVNALDFADGSDSVDVLDSDLFPDVCSHYSVLDSVLCSGYYYCFSDDFLCLLFLRRIAPLVEL